MNTDKGHDGTFKGSKTITISRKPSIDSKLKDYTLVDLGVTENAILSTAVHYDALEIIVNKEVDTAWLRTCVSNEGEAKAFEAYNETVSEKQKLTFEEYMELYSRLNLKDYLKK